jgi:general secretion pathway protein L
MTIGEALSRLLDAFVDLVLPLAGRFRSKSRLVVVDGDEGLRFYKVERGKPAAIGDGSTPDERQARQIRRAAGGPIELRLAPDRLIARSLQLPAAGKDYLAPIIEHRLERLTPWRPDKVMYGFAVSGEASEEGTMDVEFLATSEEIAARSIERLADLQIAPTALGSAAEPIEQPLRIDLYRGERDVGRQRLRRALARAAVIAAVVLVPGVAASSWLAAQADNRLASVEERLALKRNVLRAATGATDTQSRDLQLINAKRPDSAAMLLVDRLASLLPDTTFLRELEIDGAKVRFAGHSADAPALIPMLEADDALSDVQFSAPVTRDDTGRDSFDIVAVWDARAQGGAVEEVAPDATLDEFGAVDDASDGDPLTDPLRTGALR